MSRKGGLVVGLVIIYVPLALLVADYVAGALFYLANKTVPEDLSLYTWPDAWDAYKEDAEQRKRLQFGAAMGLGLVVIVPGFVLLSQTTKGRSLYGDARFASSSEIRKAGLMGTTGIIVGKLGKRFLLYPGQEFVLVAAPTRSGKGVSLVIPNLLHFDGSVVVLDIKMENFLYTSRFRASHGQGVYLFNPFAEDFRTHRWNPLDGIDRSPDRRVGEILAIAHVLYPTEQVQDAFWNESARNLFLGLTLYLMETPDLPCTLGELLRQASGKGQPIKDYLSGIVSWRSTGDRPLSGDCREALQRFYNNSENTLASILATFVAPLTIFSNPIVDAATSATDFLLDDVRRRPMSIYVGIPPNRLSDAALLVNLFFSQLIHKNTRELPATNPALRYPCLLLMDEFTAPGRVEIIAKSVGFFAGYNLRLLSIVQGKAQLQRSYGEYDAQTLVMNHGCHVVFAPHDQAEAEDYSRMLGTYTAKAVSIGNSRPRGWGRGDHGSRNIHESEHARALLLPQELRALGADQAILQVRNQKAICCQKARFYDDAVFVTRLQPFSPALAALKGRLPSQGEWEQAALVKRELSTPIPLLNLELHRAKVEGGVRPLTAEDPIDPARLAMDLSALPPVVTTAASPVNEVKRFVDAFFDQLEWKKREASPATEHRQVPAAYLHHDDRPAHVLEEGGSSAKKAGGRFDFSLLDDNA